MSRPNPSTRKSNPTLADVARAAGCSIGTVSGILSGKGSHASATVAKVREAVRITGFVSRRKPHQNPLHDSQFTLFFPENDAPGSARSTFLGRGLTRGVEEVLSAERHHLLLAEARSDGSVPALVSKGQIDGLILRAADYPAPFLKAVGGLPAVWAFGIHPPPLHMDLVSVDNVRLGILAADRLAESGAHEVVIMSRRTDDNLEVLIRILSCEHALRQRNIRVTRMDFENAAEELPGHRSAGKSQPAIFIPGHDADVIRAAKLLSDSAIAADHLLGTVMDHETVSAACPSARFIRIDPVAVGRATAKQLLWRLHNLHAPPQTVLVRAVG